MADGGMSEFGAKPFFDIHGTSIRIPVSDTVVWSWVAIGILAIGLYIGTRNLKKVPGKFQSVLEMYVGTINNFCSETIGHHGRAFAPYIGMIGLFLAVLNTMGIFGVKPPTRDFSVTAAMAIMTMLIVIFASFRYKGIVGFIKSLFKPVWFMFPMNLLEYLIRPLSLSMRLFGNVFGALVMMELVIGAAPLVIPGILSIYLDIFDGILQAYVFMFLTTLYIAEAVE